MSRALNEALPPADVLGPHLAALASAGVLVVGDVMLDRYWHGSASRLSPEAPVPVVRVERDECRPGGAANVAVNVAALGARATVVGITGEDADGGALRARLEEAGVCARLVQALGVRTVTKLRVLGARQPLIRLDFEDGLPGGHEAGLLERFVPLLADASAVVVSDYGKGTLREPRGFIQAARAAGRPVLVAPKGRDFTRYAGATVLVPNRGELEAVVGPCPEEAVLTARGLELVRTLSLGALLVTRGEEGMTLLREGHPALHLRASATSVVDVTGAGDTVIAVLAAALGSGVPLPEAVALANAAAGLVVGRPGTSAVTLPELRRALTGPRESARGVVTEERLMALVHDARARGETVALTLGCFDILHAGHVSYLEQMAGLADRLIIAVNDDDSVRRLKGPSRPLNPLAQRMRVLAGLAAVDWVVPFSEDTPERLVCRVVPDVLVKGGDYRPEQIPGQRCVREAGGRVLVLDYVEGCSTTGLVARIHERQGAAKVGPASAGPG
ncbi:bifunctional D-glycero-beta-D-manno-heptose-7-phosphate kinase/D-glycero-beta-D-manno-heptose 1-phosphate adenylyltransferase HldE [Corallococcus sp. EGB]|uniref:bifunctional D-glycero-beta-D-manno-heptose-7-phosphate kinase/D-glycero-beta-D-manno-heptose 1-phosphate adenylyltransferase HldE n=1 Tax=Corallococcus sp. EGB TaxID=1521117 RepID=UPI001CBF3054|nr:bifunctional D-glycero-beta-D-manno-heptose-7-phosphate kinase/D-glycero-beta-D-manno-heptose 1-phosphate adenylyltransferase HldE [Corallococcus sp. EGB]